MFGRPRLLLSLAVVAAVAAGAPNHASAFARDGESSDCLKKHSRAWCVLDAANMTRGSLKDLDGKALEKSLRSAKVSGDGWWYGGAVVGLSSGYLAPTRGLPSGLEVSVFALTWLLSGYAPDSFGWNGAFGWMPLEEAANSWDAQEKFTALVRSRIREVFSEYTFSDIEWVPVPDARGEIYSAVQAGAASYVLRGKECDQKVCRLIIPSSAVVTAKAKRPEWLGGGDAWAVGAVHGNASSSFLVWRFTVDGVDSTPSYLGKLSSLLPDWAFVWASPEYKRNGMKVNIGQRVPGVYTKGKFMGLVFPEFELPATPSSGAQEPATPASAPTMGSAIEAGAAGKQ